MGEQHMTFGEATQTGVSNMSRYHVLLGKPKGLCTPGAGEPRSSAGHLSGKTSREILSFWIRLLE